MSGKINTGSFFFSLVCVIFTIQLFYAELNQTWSVVPPAYIMWLLTILTFIAGILGFRDKRSKKARARSWFTVLVSLCLSVVLSLPLLQSVSIAKEPMKTTHSPDGNYTIHLYRINGGAATAISVRGELDGPLWFKKKIYFDYREDQAEAEWENDHTVSLNNHVLNLDKGETYNGY